MILYEFDILGLFVGQTEEAILPHTRFSSITPPVFNSEDEEVVFAHTHWVVVTKAKADEMRADYQAALNAPRPVIKPTQYSKLDFMRLFTMSELEAIYTAAKTDIQIEISLDLLKAAEFVSTKDQRTIDYVNLLETKTLIAVGRANEILDIQTTEE